MLNPGYFTNLGLTCTKCDQDDSGDPTWFQPCYMHMHVVTVLYVLAHINAYFIDHDVLLLLYR